MHLTNYAVNKHSPDFEFNQDAERDNIGHKRSFSSILKVNKFTIYSQKINIFLL